MALFGIGKKEVVDLSAEYRMKKKFEEKMKQRGSSFSASPEPASQIATSSNDGFDFIGGLANASANESPVSSYVQPQNEFSSSIEEEDKRKKLAKRIMDMTDKIEDLSNQMYRLQQRIELIERKLNGRSES